MIRKFKALGLALVAVLAMSVVVASAAQAAPVVTTTGSTSVHATGEKIGEQFTIDGVTVTCEVSHYTGTATNGSSTLRVTPTYTGCKVGEAIPATITTHSCHYLFHLTKKDAGAPTPYTSTVNVECTEKPITIASTNPECFMEVKSQTGLGTVTATNGATDVNITPNVSGIKGTVTKDGFLCPFSSVGEKTGGTYKTTSPITATTASGSIQVSGE